jgi:hypothetical protein
MAGLITRKALEAQKWFEKNSKKMNKHVGSWVAISGTGIVAESKTLDDLTKNFGEYKSNELIITRVMRRANNVVYIY